MNKNKYYTVALTATFVFFLISCGDDDKKQKRRQSSIFPSSSFTLVMDESVSELMERPVQRYKKKFRDSIYVKDTNLTARRAMAKLFANDTKVAVIARDYLPDEKILLKRNGVKPFRRIKIATDALVFLVHETFPVQFTTVEHLREILTEGKYFNDFYEGSAPKYDFYIKERNSSEFSNLELQVLNLKELKRNVNIMNSYEEIIRKVSMDPKAIGIGYLSQFHNLDSTVKVKMLPIQHVDDAGNVTTAPVHQAYLVMGKYPFPVDIWVYLLDNSNNLPFWFASYITKERPIVKYYKEMGIVPDHAKFNLQPTN